nr:hypothetical protein [Tanacetum cinerariifolium]
MVAECCVEVLYEKGEVTEYTSIGQSYYWGLPAWTYRVSEVVRDLLETHKRAWSGMIWNYLLYTLCSANKRSDSVPSFHKLIIADLMKKFPSIAQRLDENYHFIKDDIPLVSVYTTGIVTVRGMLIINKFLTDDICATMEYKEYENVFGQEKILEEDIDKMVDGDDEDSCASAFADLIFQDKEDTKTRTEPESHKENSEVVNDDDVNDNVDKEDKDDENKVDDDVEKENKDEENDDDDEDDDNGDYDDHALVKNKVLGSLETRNAQTHTPIPSPI